MSITAISRSQASAPRAPAAVEPVVKTAQAATASRNTVMAELPQTPRPLTPATAAVHLMNVPSSRVLEAVVSLQRAMGLQTPSDPPPALRSGAVIDVSA